MKIMLIFLAWVVIVLVIRIELTKMVEELHCALIIEFNIKFFDQIN